MIDRCYIFLNWFEPTVQLEDWLTTDGQNDETNWTHSSGSSLLPSRCKPFPVCNVTRFITKSLGSARVFQIPCSSWVPQTDRESHGQKKGGGNGISWHICSNWYCITDGFRSHGVVRMGEFETRSYGSEGHNARKLAFATHWFVTLWSQRKLE